MCIEDIYIGRHSRVQRIPLTGATTVITPDPRRLAFVVSQYYYAIFQTQQGVEWANLRAPQLYSSFATTMTNNATPTANTGTMVASLTDYVSESKVLHIRDYGALIQQGGFLIQSTATPTLWEVLMDDTLERRLQEIEEGGWK